jgi:hypothetical protein
MTAPTLRRIYRETGVAGQVAYRAYVRYPDCGGEEIVQFVGSVYGGPVVLVVGNHQMFVTDPGRFGPRLTPQWVRRFFHTT